MPEYLAPGVFVEEVSFRSKSIEGVGTSVAAIVGPTRFGPTRGKPEVVTSFGEFTRTYGDLADLEHGAGPANPTPQNMLNHTAIAAKAFFDNGGKQLFVARAYLPPIGGTGFGSATSNGGVLTFQSRWPGRMGNFLLELVWRDRDASPRRFDLLVRSRGRKEDVIYSYANLRVDAASLTGGALAENPNKQIDRLTSPLSCTVSADATPDSIFAALEALFTELPPEPGIDGPALPGDPRPLLVRLQGGNDGQIPGPSQYEGVEDQTAGHSGLRSLEDIEDISIVMAPAAAAREDNHQAIINVVQAHCRRMRYRVGIVDSRDPMTLAEVRAFRSNFDDSRLALYYPWVMIADPRPGGAGVTIRVPPAGFIAGVYANTDVQRGVHKAPANEIVIGALRFAQEINRFQQELLNPDGINCLRSFPGRGHRVWGGRTLSSDPEWKYVNVRRYFLYLERSIDKSTQWVVFEPNGERLWENVRATVEGFLYNEWKNGRLLGSEKTAYFVRCDRSTMTQNDLDNGRLVCEIGVAPLRPAEFVIFRIGQKTADA